MFSDITISQYIILIILLITFLVQVSYHIRYYLGALIYKQENRDEHNLPVSIVICARNEEENLKKNLPSILSQKHSNYEVIVVNDCSDDNSSEVLTEMQSVFPNLKVSSLNVEARFRQGKKFAQLIGVKAASNELILLTDADCRPESENWLRFMTSPLAKGKSIVLGYGGYSQQRGLLNKYIRYDTLFIALQYFGMAITGRPYMGVGRNLAYLKSLFISKNGYSGHYHIPSGDDDLFVNANATADNTAIELRPEAHTRSNPKTNFMQFWRQKQRHMSAAKLYKSKDKLALATEPLSRIIFFAALIIVAMADTLWPVAAVTGVLRVVSLITITTLASIRMKERGIIIATLFFDIISPILNSLLYISSRFMKRDQRGWR